VVSELLPRPSRDPKDDSSGGSSQTLEPSKSDLPSCALLSTLALRLASNGQTLSDGTELAGACLRLAHLLSHLPFVSLIEQDRDVEVHLINPRSISLSALKDGAAQCFLVLASVDMNDKLPLKDVVAFVSESKYGSHVRLMSSIDRDVASGLSQPYQARFFAEAHTFALAV